MPSRFLSHLKAHGKMVRQRGSVGRRCHTRDRDAAAPPHDTEEVLIQPASQALSSMSRANAEEMDVPVSSIRCMISHSPESGACRGLPWSMRSKTLQSWVGSQSHSRLIRAALGYEADEESANSCLLFQRKATCFDESVVLQQQQGPC